MKIYNLISSITENRINRQSILKAFNYFVAALVALATIVALISPLTATSVSKTPYEEAYSSLSKIIFSIQGLEHSIRESLDESDGEGAPFRCFVAVSDGTARAKVFMGSGFVLKDAFSRAMLLSQSYCNAIGGNGLCIKAEFVDSMEKKSKAAIKRELESVASGYYRYGVSFGDSFDNALTEAEMYAYRIYSLDESDSAFMFVRLNNLLAALGKDTLAYVPERVIKFSCKQFFYSNGQAYELSSNPASSAYGSKAGLEHSLDAINAQIGKNTDFLLSLLGEDGMFQYGIWPCTGNNIQGYNILRHMGAVWSLIDGCTQGDYAMKLKIERAIEAFLHESVISTESGKSYVYDSIAGEIKLGGAAIAVCALVRYMESFGDMRYIEHAQALGRGILSMMDLESGVYEHVLYYGSDDYDNFSVKQESRSIIYDGEATLGLLYLYRMSNEEIWLDAAKAAIGNFMRNDYAVYGDHWVAYCMDEATKTIDSEAYYNFALRCISENLGKLQRALPESHTGMEFLMASYSIYERMLQRSISPSYLPFFDTAAFIGTIFDRADVMQRSCFSPQQAIFMSSPGMLSDIFFVRSDEFRIRIDDLQHFINGYRMFADSYKSLEMAKKTAKPPSLYIESIDTPADSNEDQE
ncbi:MAG: hypothetical protein FWG30_11040 [Eubacteriaceae bacterium]|nr:hypothetical protein [Eubacteriaceae bacterium]